MLINHRHLALVVLGGALACSRVAPHAVPAPVMPFATDTSRTQAVAPGVVHRYLYASSGPWAVHVLDVDLARCNSVVALKGGDGAIGREKTSTLASDLAKVRTGVIGAVNADFFLFTPPGVPTGTLITNGRLVTGPSDQAVLALDSAGRVRIAPLYASGSAVMGGQTVAIAGWNHALANGVALFDGNWGGTLDTASSTIEVVLDASNPRRVVRVDTMLAGTTMPPGGVILVAGRHASAAARAALRRLVPGDSVRTSIALSPLFPREAVGGRVVLVRDSVIAVAPDSAGEPGFVARNPRTAAGIRGNGTRLVLAVVDGRQKPYSDGMTLHELASLMLALGARDAINLDGGGSSTLVYADPDSAGALRIANKPSDKGVERSVGDALGILHGCSTR
jgi:exopolysaccharide biosynthesis protein